MPARHFLLLVRRYWRLVAISVILCSSAAVILALVKAPVYEARTQFFVSTSGDSNAGDAYRGELFSQQRVASYAEIVSSTELTAAVARLLRLPEGTRELDGKLRASVIPDTVLIDVTASAGSPAQAKAIADAVALQLPRFIEALETPRGASTSPVMVSVTREAEVPASPSSPDMRLYVALGLVAGLAVGLAAVALSAGFDRRVRSIEAIERIAGAPVIGTVTEDSGDRGPLLLLDDPLSARAEDYRRLRTQLLVRWGSPAISSLVVSGAGRRDETASIAANLGLVLAHGGQRVVLVDGDWRDPRLSELFGLGSHVGLTEVLAGAATPDEVLSPQPQSRLAVMAAGTPPPGTGNVVSSPRLPAVIAALREHADVVIIDAPSLADGADASTLAASASAFLLVTRLESITAAQLASAAQAVGSGSELVLGAVVNRRASRRRRRRAVPRAAARGPAAPAPPTEPGARPDAAARRPASGSRM